MCILSLFNQTLTKIIYFVEVVTVLDVVFQSIKANNLISNKKYGFLFMLSTLLNGKNIFVAS